MHYQGFDKRDRQKPFVGFLGAPKYPIEEEENVINLF
jgi:hypothetical protein